MRRKYYTWDLLVTQAEKEQIEWERYLALEELNVLESDEQLIAISPHEEMIDYEGYDGLWKTENGYIHLGDSGAEITIYDDLGRVVFADDGKDPGDLIIEKALAAKDARLGRSDLLP